MLLLMKDLKHYMMNIRDYSKILAAARTYLDLTIEQVAAILNVDYKYVMALEEGWLQPTKKDIVAFEKLYGIDFEEEFKWDSVDIDGVSGKDRETIVGLMRFMDMLGSGRLK